VPNITISGGTSGKAGTQSGGGAGGSPDGQSGSLGQGGNGGAHTGGAGGGFFGGGGGGEIGVCPNPDFCDGSEAPAGGGGGGSNLVPEGGSATLDDSGDPSIAISYTTNQAPVARDDALATDEDTLLTGNVLANDTDPDGNPLEAVLVSGPANGTLTLNNANGTFSYTHNGSETTSDSFTYKASDGGLDSNVATVNITVTLVNDAPTVKVAAGGACGTNDRSGQINLTVENPDGPEGSLTLSAASRTRDQALLPNQNLVPVHTTAPTWTLSATALSGKTGTARITVTVSDGQDTGTVDVTVTVDGNGSKTTNGTGGADLLFGQNRRAKRLGWQRPPLRRKGQRHPQRRSGR
jgi:hypothetical protein